MTEKTKTFPLDADFRVRVTGWRSTPEEATQRQIDEHWELEQAKRNGTMFNNPILILDAVTAREVTGSFVDYKTFLGYRSHPEWGERLCPVGVSGFMLFGGKVLFGQRSDWVMQYPGGFELVPGGCIDGDFVADEAVDWRAQLLQEMEEEVGIGEGAVEEIRPLAAIQDLDDLCLDLCFLVMGRGDVPKTTAHVKEVADLVWVDEGRLKEFVQSKGQAVLPTSRALVDLWVGR